MAEGYCYDREVPDEFDVAIVGAGQAGLALGYYLQRQGRNFTILDGAREIGASWRGRWDSLTLFSPARYDALPGLAFPAPANCYPGKDAVADYLASYAKEFDLPVQLERRVTRLEQRGGRYLLETTRGPLVAQQVVVATGPFHCPRLPPFAKRLGSEVTQLHSSRYRSPGSLPPGEVLVVGTGNSGWQIALELAASRDVVLAGRELPRVPPEVLGRSIFWWMETTGVTRIPGGSALGKRMRRNDDVVIGYPPPAHLRERLRRVPRVVDATAGRVAFADGPSLAVSNVVWATGYRQEFGWVKSPVFDGRGRPVHRRGVTASPGLYFLGLRWLHTTGSALLGFVGRDARYIARRIAAFWAASGS